MGYRIKQDPPVRLFVQNALQTTVTALWFLTAVFGGTAGFLLSLYLIAYTRFWYLTVAYLAWAWVVDKDTPEQGGRRIPYLKSLPFWKYFTEYFPLRIDRTKGVSLDPTRNYLLCYFPNTVVPFGAFGAFAAPCSFNEIFPYHKTHIVTSNRHFVMPFFRDLILALGGCSSSAKSIDHILQDAKGGNACVITVGEEPLYTKEGEYKVALRNSKGFVYRALKNGTPLVPVFSFGESDIFSSDDKAVSAANGNGQTAKGASPVIPIGRSLLQYSLGLIPRRRPVSTIGKSKLLRYYDLDYIITAEIK